ncbi:hypothetical protein [Devosia aurantiaca]|uniref:Uncharacterized protein n=1 Tax=Devosia aurantiaca TaxID=2714858 RepID=A0A6M1SLU3_9HYPH|nr:hypothetical protein [Devosia aurantiaca]NGP16502.1 hypothetical protein [Devosia aurantiaca]
MFDGEAVFVYAPYSADKVALREVEKKLNDALMPPYSLRDFTVEVKQAKAAWQ